MHSNTTSPQAQNHILRRTDFDTQLTQQVMERVLKQTIALVADLERKTPWRDQLGPDDRLHTAIVKTLDGTRKWDPDRVNLGGHLFGVVSSDITSELKHSERYRHLSWEDDEHQDLDALREEAEVTLARDAEPANNVGPPVELRPAWALALYALKQAANDEREVLAIIEAYRFGAFTKREVMGLAKLKSRAYDRAYARLIDLADTIDEGQRDFILRAIA
jgi:hypothetical protein